jgi:hypothetical protein
VATGSLAGGITFLTAATRIYDSQVRLPILTVEIHLPTGDILGGPAVVDSGADVSIVPMEPLESVGIQL